MAKPRSKVQQNRQARKPDEAEVQHAIDKAPDVDTSDVQAQDDTGPGRLLEAHKRYIAATTALREDRAEADRRKQELEARDRDLGQRTQALAAAEERLLEREQSVSARERDFDAGFTERRRERLAEMTAELETLRSAYDAVQEQLRTTEREVLERRIADEAQHAKRQSEAAERGNARLFETDERAEQLLAQATETADRLRSEAEATLVERRAALASDQEALRAERQALEAKEIAVDAREHEVAARESRLEQEVTAKARMEVARSQRAAQALAKERDDVQTQYAALVERYAALKQQDRRLEGLDPDEVDRLRSENERLHDRLAAAPSAADATTLARLEAELGIAVERANAAEANAATLSSALQAQRHVHEDLQELTDERDRALAQREALRSEVERLREDLDLLRGAAESTAPDADLVAIDDAAELDRAAGVPRLRQDAPTLRELVAETRAAMATSVDARHYSDDLVRCFVAGLAASRFHILEGISGTGKTSLPIAFAQAVDVQYEVVEVQAAWRDRLDLLGHYSHLQRRYYSTGFARALYHAATPAWSSAPMFVVLDEMNLSHPEQYFADVLSALERPLGDQEIEFLQSDGRGAQLRDGRRLPLPRNVWFIGTANRDETTMTIADKTYDRAHLMELPARFEEQQGLEAPRRRGALGFAHLQSEFERAREERVDDVRWVTERIFDEHVLDVLAECRVGIGSRLRRQAREFVSVYTASGGPRHLALDHLLATKLVRKLEAVFDLHSDYLDLLEVTIRDAVRDVELQQLPTTQYEIKRQRARVEA